MQSVDLEFQVQVGGVLDVHVRRMVYRISVYEARIYVCGVR